MMHESDVEKGRVEGDDAEGFTREFRPGLEEVLTDEKVVTDRDGLRQTQGDALKQVAEIVKGD